MGVRSLIYFIFWDVTQRKIIVSFRRFGHRNVGNWLILRSFTSRRVKISFTLQRSLKPRIDQVKTSQFQPICIIDFLITHFDISHAIYYCLIVVRMCRGPRAYHGSCSVHTVSQPRVRLEPALAPKFVHTISFLVLQFSFFHSSRTVLTRLCQYRLLCHSLWQSAMHTTVRVATFDKRNPTLCLTSLSNRHVLSASHFDLPPTPQYHCFV